MYLASLESVSKVKCFMFRNSLADCCSSCSRLIACLDFSSSSEAEERTPVNLQKEITGALVQLLENPSDHYRNKEVL